MKKDSAQLDHSLKLLVKTSVIVFIGIFLSKLLSYVYRIIIARYYGPEVYGLFSLTTMILAMILTFSLLGFSAGISRFIPQYRGKKESDKISYLFWFVNKILFVTSITFAVLLFFLADFIAVNIFHNLELVFLLKILSFFVPFAVFSVTFLESIRSYELISSYSFIYNILQNIVRVTALIILVMLGFQSSAAVVSYCLGFLAVLITSYVV